MSKRFLKYTKKFIIAFIMLIGLYFLSAYCLSHITVNPHPHNKEEIAIYIISNGIHTDIVVPAKTIQKDWTQEIRYNNTLATDSSYIFLAIGWGDRKFYLETPTFSDLKLSTALRAISGLSTSAMHTTYYQNITEDEYCKKILISAEQYSVLNQYIANSFETDSLGHIIKVNTNIHYDKGDAFYEAKGSYSIFKTCNTWANNALKASGQKSCLWTIFDTAILQKYK